MTTADKIVIIFFILLFSNGFGQTQTHSKDSLFKVIDARKEKIRLQHNLDISDSIQIIGKLIDFDFGTTCGQGPGAGIFFFELLKADKNNYSDTNVFVIIQCAHIYEKIIEKSKKYKMTISPTKPKSGLDIDWLKYKDKRYRHLFLTMDRHCIIKIDN